MNQQIVQQIVGGVIALGFVIYAFFAEKNRKQAKELQKKVKEQRINLDVLEHEIELQRKYYDQAFEDFKNNHIPASMLDDIGQPSPDSKGGSGESGGNESTH